MFILITVCSFFVLLEVALVFKSFRPPRDLVFSLFSLNVRSSVFRIVLLTNLLMHVTVLAASIYLAVDHTPLPFPICDW